MDIKYMAAERDKALILTKALLERLPPADKVTAHQVALANSLLAFGLTDWQLQEIDQIIND